MEEKEKAKPLIAPYIFLALVLVTWGLTPVVTFKIKEAVGDHGTFGDLFGSINALFSGFAFVGLIWAIKLQQKELKLQRETIDLQRQELKQNTQELKNQAAALNGQLEVARLSAQLAALPNLIDSELNVLKEYQLKEHISITSSGAIAQTIMAVVREKRDLLRVQQGGTRKGHISGHYTEFVSDEVLTEGLMFIEQYLDQLYQLRRYRGLLKELFDELQRINIKHSVNGESLCQ